MKMMRILTIAFAALMSVVPAYALTNIWPFDVSGQYVVSDTNRIEVAASVARLKLLSTRTRHSTIQDYTQANTANSGVALGADGSLAVAMFGNTYAGAAQYTSRVLDGGAGNIWQLLSTRVLDRSAGPSILEISSATAGLMALYHFNNNWQDAISSQNGVPYGGPVFTTDGKFGAYAGSFVPPAYLQTANAALLNGLRNWSISFWMKLRKIPIGYAGYAISRGSSYFGLRAGASGSELQFYPAMGVVVTTPTFLKTNQWYFIAATAAGGVGQKQRIYVNGQLYAEGTANPYLMDPVIQDDFIKIPSDDGLVGYSVDGTFDEIAIFNRELSSAEILGMYSTAYSVGFQVRSGSALPLTSSFTGPDGSVGTYYGPDVSPLLTAGNFNVYDQYAQYRAFMLSSPSATPSIDAVTLIGSRTVTLDDSLVDFSSGDYTLSSTNLPAQSDTPYVKLAKLGNGGYSASGTYTSKIFDQGSSTTWRQVAWQAWNELPSSLNGLGGLWHMNESWADSSGNGLNGTSYGVSYTPYAKFGSASAVFSGAGAYVDIGRVSASISSVELWLKPDTPNGGVLDLGTGVGGIAISNNMIAVSSGVGGTAKVYVNSRESRALLPGWNHLVVTFTPALVGSTATVGRVSGAYFAGQMDEMAIYTTPLSGGDILTHFVNGMQSVAGRIRFQCRADTTIPMTTAFVGPNDTTNTYFIDGTGGALPPSFDAKQYFQYRTFLEGDGNASPILRSVAITYGSGLIMSNATKADFMLGTFDGGTTIWNGDEMRLPSAYARGPVNTDPLTSETLLGLWHMDDGVWASGSTSVRDSSGNGKHGLVSGTAQAITNGARVGVQCGSFATNGSVTVTLGDFGTNDLSVSLWFQSSVTNRSGLISSYSGARVPYFALELNGDEISTKPGIVSFVISDGASVSVVVANRPALNDGQWHHLSAMRCQNQAFIYVDGVMAGSAYLGSGFGGLGGSAITFAKHGSLGFYYSGYLDEVAIHGRALGKDEITELAAAGFNTHTQGSYTGPILDAGQPTYWGSLSWITDGPYGRPHDAEGASMLGLWHFDSISNGWTQGAIGIGNDGQVVGGAVIDPQGKFSGCMRFSGAVGQQIRVSNSGGILQSAIASVEAWVNLDDAVSRVIFDLSSGGVGYRLGTDSQGCPFFWVNGTTGTGTDLLRVGQWNHVAGVYDGGVARLYVNGSLVARTTVSGSVANSADARIGSDQSGNGTVVGRIDEAALYSRVLTGEEVLDHYRAGAVTLKFQARSWTPAPQGPFVGPDGTTNTYFVNSSGSSLLGVTGIGINNLFQYKAFFGSEDARLTPCLKGIFVDASGYPTDNPWVAPGDGFGTMFQGNLVSYSHVMQTNTDAAVHYQISGNNGTNWYAWVNSQWADVTIYTNAVSSWQFSNTKDVINTNIGSFYDQLYPKVGGVFKFKAFLKSDAIQQVALDSVTLGYAGGRIVVTIPNGQEVGDNAWLIGVPYTVQWVSSGTVSSKLKLEYSLSSGAAGSWVTIATNVANVAGTNNYSFWITPGTVSDFCRVRVTDMNDATIGDLSDADFSLVQRFRIVAPNGGEKWYTGKTNTIRWASSLNLGLLTLDFADDLSSVVTNFINVAFGVANQAGSPTNQYLWATPLGNPGLLSETAKMRIRTLGGQGEDFSDNIFTLAGIEITNPTVGSAVKRNSSFNLRWMSAGAGGAVALDFSMDSGGSWTNVVPSIPNVVGSNTYAWVASAAPTDLARLRLRSLSDTNVVGVSALFTLADIDVLAPTAGTNWLMSTTNVVKWASGGAGNQVNIYYSTNNGGGWVPIILNYTNVSGYNSYQWVVPRYPGALSQVKVESVQDPVNLWAASPNFNIAGIRVTNPNGGEKWDKDVLTTLQWDYQSVGQNGTVQFTYDGGLTYTNIGGPGLGLSDRAYLYTATKPTVRAKVKIIADDPSPFTNVFDESDAYFTVAGITVTTPTNGVFYTIGSTNAIEWNSAGSEDPLNQARIYYTTTGADSNLIAVVGNNQAYPGANTFQWNIQPGVIPSTTARIIVRSGAYSGRSDAFVLRGIRFSNPGAGTIFDIGANAAVAWVYAGLDASAVGYLYLSTDGGKTFGATAINASQVWPVQGGGYPWKVSADTDPTTNAVLKFRVTSSSKPEDVGFEALSQPFAIRGLRMLVPNAASVWSYGETNRVQWLSALAGSYASLFYSPDGLTYDVARPLTLNQSLTDGTNAFAWSIDSGRLPSTNARIRVVSGSISADSSPFTLRGIRVTIPSASDVWAVDETNRISWTAVGASGTYTVSLLKDGVTVIPIAAGVTDTFFDWIVPTNSVSSNDIVVVQDTGGLRGQSDQFKIVGEPTVTLVSPTADEFWKVSQTYTIKWSKGGKMSNNFHIQYSTYPYVVTNEIYNGIVDFDTTNNIFSTSWQVKDRLGGTVIIVQNNDRDSVKASSSVFYVVGMFTVVAPNGGETNLYALKPTTLSWFTRGSVPAVNLYYSVTPLHETGSWVRINSAPVANNGGGLGDQVTSYDWTIANVESDTVRIRVEQADRPGAYDDSDADFAIRYYQIIWHVFDVVTSNNLNSLNVVDSSGWSQADMTSPIVHRYPYGVFNTVWGREYFFNNVIFSWTSEPSRVIDVPLSRSSVEPDYGVMANFVYDATNSQFRATSWLQKTGRTIINPTKCTISVFDSTGAMVIQLASLTPDANGVFWQSIPNTLAKGMVYFAKVEIQFSGATYSSGVTFNLRIPTDAEQAQLMMNALTNIQGIVSRVDTNLTDLATAQAIFRASAGAKLDSLTNSAEVIKSGLTNLDVKVSLLSTQALAQLSVLTNTIGVIGPGETNLLDLVKTLSQSSGTRDARILTRPTSVKLGSKVDILYRSVTGVTASYQVFNSLGGVVEGSLPMGGGTGGIYEQTLTAGWGIGEYKIVCTDISGASDRMILKITASDIDDVAGSMVGVSNQLAGVELTLATMSVSVSNINHNVGVVTNELAGMIVSIDAMSNVIGQVAGLTNMASSVSAMTGAVAQITVLTNMGTQLSYLTNLLTRMGGLTNLTPEMAYLTNAVTQLQGLTNLTPQMAYLTNVINQVTALTNMASSVSAMTGAVAQISGLTNMGSQLAYLTNAVGSLTTLTNLVPQMAYLTNITASTAAQTQYLTNLLTQMGGLTNLAPQMSYLTNGVAQLQGLTNLNAQVAYLTNVINQVTALTNMANSVSAMTGAVAQISGLTNMGAQLSYLTNAMGSVQSLTNMTSQMAFLTNMTANTALQMQNLSNSVAQLQTLTNLNAQMAYLTNVINQVTALTNIASSVSAMTGAVAQISGLTNISAQVAQMTNSINQIAGMTNLPTQMSYLTNVIGQLTGLTNISAQVAQMTNSIGQIAGMTNLPSQMNYLTNVISQLSGMTNIGAQVAQMTNSINQIAGMTNLPAQMDFLTNVISQLSGMTNIGVQVGQMTNSINQIAGLTNLYGQMNYLTNAVEQFSVLTGMVSQVSDISNSLARLSGLTNMPAQVGYLTNVINQLTGLTNISAQVAQMTNSINQVAGMTNLPTQMSYLTNVISQLTGLTNISAQVAQMTNSINQVAGMTNLPTQMSYLTNVIGQLTGLTNISAQVAQMTNSINQVAGMTNLPTQMSYLTNVMGQLTGLTNINAQMAQITNSINQVANLTNLAAQVSYLTNTMAQLSLLTNISAQVAEMTNSINQITGLTNIEAQVAALTNLNAQMAFLTNAVSTLGSLSNDMAGVVAAIGQLGSLTNMGSQVAVLTNSIGQIVALTNMSGQINGLATGLSQLMDATKTMSNTLASFTGTIGSLQNASNSLSTVTTMNTSLASMTAISSNIYTMIEGGLGTASDSAAANTVFGRIAAIEDNVTKVGGQASAAAQRASGARSQANSAAGAAQRIKQNMASSTQMDTVMTDVGVIRKSLENALANLKAIPGNLNTSEMMKTVQGAQKTIQEVAESRGVSLPGGAEPKGEPGSLSDPKAVQSLINQLSETKAMMQATRQLMDEAVNKPVVVDWLEGSK